MLRKLLALMLMLGSVSHVTAQTLGDHHVRAVYSEESPVYNVKTRTYGAVGDGPEVTVGVTNPTCTDDTAAIQSAINAMVADGIPGSVLYFPPGVYCVTATLSIPAHDNYYVVGTNATLVIDAEINGPILLLTSATNFEVAGLMFVDGDSAAHDIAVGDQTHGLICDACTDGMIRDNFFEGFGDECLDVYDTVSGGTASVVSNIKIRGNHFKDCAEIDSTGSSIGVRKGSNIQIKDNFIEGAGAFGASGIKIDCPTGECADTVFRDIQITGNQISNVTGHGVTVANADSISSGIIISGNVIRPGMNGIRVAGSAGGTNTRMQISGNTIEDGGDSLDLGTDGAAIYVTVNSSDGAGAIYGNVIDSFGVDNNHRSIYVTSGGWSISHNQITDAKIGIQSTTSSDPNLIEGNHIDTFSSSAIYAVDADVVMGNHIKGAGVGVYFDAGVSGGVVSGNSIQNSVTGIRLNGNNVWAIGNMISGCTTAITGSGTGSGARESGNIFVGNTATYSGTLQVAMKYGPALDLGQDFARLDIDNPTPPVSGLLCDCPGDVCGPCGGAHFDTLNLTGTTITDFTGGENGQLIFVKFGDSNTTMDFGTAESFVKGNGGVDWTPEVNDSMLCVSGTTNWYCITSNGGGGGGGGGAFSDASDPIVQNTITKSVNFGDGAGTLTAKVEIGGDANEPQFVVEGFSTQTDSIVVIQNDADVQLFNVENSGDVRAQSIQDIDGPGTLWSVDNLGASTFASVTVPASITPGIDFSDSDVTGSGDTDEIAASLDANCTTVTEGAQVCDFSLAARTGAGADTNTFLSYDGSVPKLTLGDASDTDILIQTDGVSITEADLNIINDSLIALASEVSGTLPPANGGTGVVSPTDHALYVGSGTGAMTSLGVGLDGQIPIGSTAADPVMNEIDGTNNEIEITNGPGTITIGIPTNPVLGGGNITSVKSMYWGAGAISTDGNECTAPSQVTVGSGPKLYAIACPMAASEQNGVIYGSTVMPDGYNGGTVTLELVTYMVTDDGVGTLHTEAFVMCRTDDQSINSTWGSSIDIDIVTISGDSGDEILTQESASITGDSCIAGAVLFWKIEICDTDTTPDGNCTSSAGFENDFNILGVKMEYTASGD